MRVGCLQGGVTSGQGQHVHGGETEGRAICSGDRQAGQAREEGSCGGTWLGQHSALVTAG